MKWTFILLLIILTIQSCAPFGMLPKTVERTTNTVGIYSNDCDSSDFGGKEKKSYGN